MGDAHEPLYEALPPCLVARATGSGAAVALATATPASKKFAMP